MTIFHAGYIATKQPCTLFDVALGEFLSLAHFAEAVTDNHGGEARTAQMARFESDAVEKSE